MNIVTVILGRKEKIMSELKYDDNKNKVVGGMLYLVATPIGNLSDISERALKVLNEVDFIAAEDTRNTLRLLSRFDISKTMVAYHDHNRREMGERIAERLLSGESCALVTDAGTPAISDPGEDLVVLCCERGIPVTSIPGACAAITALTLSALPTRRFVFEGFLPVPKKERGERLSAISKETRTFILHEAPHKLRTTLSDLKEALGGSRRIAICRELTKLNEEIFRTTLDGAVIYYTEKEPRGEYVLVIEGADENAVSDTEEKMSLEECMAHFTEQGMSKTEAVKATAKYLGIPRNEVYKNTIK